MTKTAQGWAPPLIGAGLGALLGNKLLPLIGAENDRINPVLGALIGAGTGMGAAQVMKILEELKAMQKSLAPSYHKQMLKNFDEAIAISDAEAMHPPIP
jgi:hypothetical protein